MFEDTYSQPHAPDPVLDDELVLSLVRRHVPEAVAVTGVDESGGEARTYTISGLIDFGDAFISHPALDMRRRAGPQDREAILSGYTSEGPVSDAFMGTWRVVQALSDLIDIAAYPERAAAAVQDLKDVIRGF